MTAINLIVQSYRAVLITDGAFYDEEGQLAAIRSKVAVHAPAKLAIATSGMTSAARLVEFMQRDPTPQPVQDALLKAIRSEREFNAGRYGEGNRLAELYVFLALWNADTAQPEGWVCGTAQGWFGPQYRPYTWAEVEFVSSPPVDEAVDPEAFEPVRDGRRLLSAQRRAPDIDGRLYTGGFGEATIVDRSGVRQERILEWPDRVGERIAP